MFFLIAMVMTSAIIAAVLIVMAVITAGVSLVLARQRTLALEETQKGVEDCCRYRHHL